MLARVAAEIGHLAIRNRGTIGGSIAHADPAAEWPLVAVTLDARLSLRSASGRRSVAAREFFAGPLTTAAKANEILCEVSLPVAPKGSRFGFAELSRRPGDFAVVAVACRVVLDDAGICRSAALGVAGAHDVPLHVAAAVEPLVGGKGDDAAIRAAGDVAALAVSPSGDVHGSADYRRKMVAVLTRRALREAFGAAS
jgi:carbon-monoxide dehydrogenase medium subunit